MQSQFTDKARTALRLAERAAGRMRQSYVGTEVTQDCHLLWTRKMFLGLQPVVTQSLQREMLKLRKETGDPMDLATIR